MEVHKYTQERNMLVASGDTQMACWVTRVVKKVVRSMVSKAGLQRAIGAALLLCSFAVQAWDLVQEEKAVTAVLTETVWQHQISAESEYERIGVHRYRHVDVPPIAALLYLPGTNMNGELSITEENYNLWLYLAGRGVEVYAMDYRTHFVSHEVREVEFMKNWHVADFVADAALLAEHIRQQLPATPLFVAGFSRGVSYAYALAGKTQLAGLIALDGSFKQAVPGGFDLASALQRFDQRGDYASVLSRRGYTARRALMQGVVDDPGAPAMKPQYDTIGEELADTLQRAWGPGALANTADKLSPIRMLATHMLDYDWYFPSIQNIEGRSLSSTTDDPNTDLDDHFGTMTLPIMYFGGTGMGSTSVLNGVYSAVQSGSKDVTLSVLEGYGHTDLLTASRARIEVFSVVERWIKQRAILNN
jgi:hypothetical protein